MNLPAIDEVLDEIEQIVAKRGHTIVDFIRSQRLAESTWYRWRRTDKERRQKAGYEAIRDLLNAANHLPNKAALD